MKLMNALVRVALITAAVSLLSLTAVAQEKKITAKDVPAAVTAAFKNSYPNATIRGYAREKERGKTFYEIESNEGTTQRDILYNADGSVAEIEESLPATALPTDAQQAIHRKYPKAVISLAEKTTAGDKVTYEVSAKQGKRRISMSFDAAGKVLSSRIR